MTHYVYILQCADGTLYTGVTRDLANRMARHNRGQGARYTRGRLPVTLVYAEKKTTLKSAMRQEAKIRRLPRAAKISLIDQLGLRE